MQWRPGRLIQAQRCGRGVGTDDALRGGPGGLDRSLSRRREFGRRSRLLLARVSTGVVVLLAVALVLRLTMVALTWNTPLSLDPEDFSRVAASIAQGHGYPLSNRGPGGGPSAFRPPGYPVFLAGVYVIAGHPAP